MTFPATAEHRDYFRDQPIAASLKRSAAAANKQAVQFPRSADRGIIEAVRPGARFAALVEFPRSADRGIIEAARLRT